MAASTSELQVSILPGELYSYLILVLPKYLVGKAADVVRLKGAPD